MGKLYTMDKIDNLYINAYKCLDCNLKNEYNDDIVSNLIIDINHMRNKLITLLENRVINDTYSLRNRKIIKGYNTNTILEIMETFHQYYSKNIEYHRRVEYLKSNCIRNIDYFMNHYNTLNNEIIKLKEVNGNLVLENDKLTNEINKIRNRQNSHSITQSIKVAALSDELSDVKTQRDFLKGLVNKNKDTFRELEYIQLENIKLKNEIDYYEYRIQHFLDEKYIINNKFNELKQELDFYKKNQLNIEDDLVFSLKNNINTLEEINIKIINDARTLIPDYIWDNKYGFIKKDYDIIEHEDKTI
jgi:hypothetical protein